MENTPLQTEFPQTLFDRIEKLTIENSELHSKIMKLEAETTLAVLETTRQMLEKQLLFVQHLINLHYQKHPESLAAPDSTPSPSDKPKT